MHVKKNATMLNMHGYKNATMLNMLAIVKMNANMFVRNQEDSEIRERAGDFEDRQSLYYKF